ncbi:hypothetical protein AZOA_47870 [Azoarcus sp. Aa7]|nr:hypothetical protein [Azoarcus sp. Aa7]
MTLTDFRSHPARRREPARRLPAYGAQLASRLREGFEPAHGIAVWIDTPPSLRGICAPLAVFADTDPAALDWSQCHRRDVFIARADSVTPERLQATVAAITAAKPRRLLLLRASPPFCTLLIPGKGAR